MIELLHEDDLDDGDELPGLNNDEISDRDDLAEVEKNILKFFKPFFIEGSESRNEGKRI